MVFRNVYEHLKSLEVPQTKCGKAVAPLLHLWYRLNRIQLNFWFELKPLAKIKKGMTK